MKDLTSVIEKVKKLEKDYEFISQQQDHNTSEVIETYLNWYSAASILFDSCGLSLNDYYLNKFKSVDNARNGYGLYDNFKSIKSPYDVLINRIESMRARNENCISKEKIFIVHGHDDEMKFKITNYVSVELNLHPVILNDCPNEGMTVIEKFEKYSEDISFAIILLSPDDVGGKNIDDLKGRARQNVIFEFGYFVAKLGRKNVCAVYRNEIEKPSDIDGVLYVPFDDNWKYNLLRELKNAGLSIMN